MNIPNIGITMGDPAGIGPEIIVSALNYALINQICNPIVIGDSGIIKHAIKLKNSNLKTYDIPENYNGDFSDISFNNNTINVLNLSKLPLDSIHPKNISAETGLAMISYIKKAVELAVSKKISAMVTAPITKIALKMAGSQFHGHTELIAKQTGVDNYAMMLAGKKLKVVLVTIHISISEVSNKLSIDNIVKTIKIAGSALKNNFGIKNPQIAVAGLNPHSGENGMFGNEEDLIIAPAIKKAKAILIEHESLCGCYVDGPFPPDTIFYHAANGKYDCVICMYHDQGLIPFKLLHFNDGVNTTIGLPIIRTSVDHGTAYDIAWQNRADHTSLVEAIKMAAAQSNN